MNILNINLNAKPIFPNGNKAFSFGEIINSPRSLEAMNNLGIRGRDLDHIDKLSIIDKL